MDAAFRDEMSLFTKPAYIRRTMASDLVFWLSLTSACLIGLLGAAHYIYADHQLKQDFFVKVNNISEDVAEALVQPLWRIAGGDYSHTLEPVAQMDLNAIVDEVNLMAAQIDAKTKRLVHSEEQARLGQVAAEAATRFKSEFLANMSHEIRTPMNAIMGLCELVLKTNLTVKQQDYLAKMQASCQSLRGIIDDILDFSKIEAGRLRMESVDFNLEDVLDNLIGLLSIKAKEKGVELLFNTAADVPLALVGDPLRLGQVLMNLTNNAVKFTEAGEIVVATKLTETSGNHAPDKIMLEFSVKDTGIGIAPDQIRHLFQAFQQADGSTTRKYGGTGLGLTISRRLVEMMGGEIHVTSELGKGSTFAFTASFICRPEAKERRYIMPPDLQGMRVLVVDDNASSREILENALLSFSFQVTQAASAKEAGADAFLIKPVNMSVLFDSIMELFGKAVIKKADVLKKDVWADEALKLMKGVRILLAEDNEINQLVASELIEGQGGIVTLAANGQEAVELAADREIDVVLMDLQMPVLDGYEATRKIREREAEKRNAGPETLPWDSRSGIPIIALTAHALTGEREKCLAAGMNDYITKPIQSTKLFEVLTRWISPSNRPATIMPQAGPGSAAGDALPAALPGINIENGLSLLRGNRVLYNKLLHLFHADHAETPARIRAALAGDDMEQIRKIAHTIKGISGNIGAMDLYTAASELETSIIQKKQENIVALLADFQQSFEIVIRSIGTLKQAETPNPANPSTPDQETLEDLTKISPLLVKLAGLLITGDADAVDCMQSIQTQAQGSPFQKQLEQLHELIEAFEYTEALATLRDLAESQGISMELG